ncbi:hypothetical protein SESBI_23867 [Sesbania bispinosa]|nr:hypothetical protein SESBI_23867 [Sesbania bispinosa]
MAFYHRVTLQWISSEPKNKDVKSRIRSLETELVSIASHSNTLAFPFPKFNGGKVLKKDKRTQQKK